MEHYSKYEEVKSNDWNFKIMEPRWEIADGRKIPFSEITQQHWSNIYWYHRYIEEMVSEGKKEDYGVLYDFVEKKIDHARYACSLALVQLKNRFKGQLLEWIPVYENEKEWYKRQSTRKVLIEKAKNV